MCKMKLAIVALLMGGSFALADPAPEIRTARPNIVIILADDMGYSDVGCYGGEIPLRRTSTIWPSAAFGSPSFITRPLLPTRASLLSGLYPIRRAWAP